MAAIDRRSTSDIVDIDIDIDIVLCQAPKIVYKLATHTPAQTHSESSK